MNKLPDYKFGWAEGVMMAVAMAVPVFILVALAAMLKNMTGTDYTTGSVFLMLTMLAQYLGPVLAFNYLFCKPQTGSPLKFNLELPKISNVILSTTMLIGMMLIVEYLTSLIPTTGEFFGELYEIFNRVFEVIGKNTAVLVIATVILAPIFEEIIFRGIMQRGMINSGVRPWKAILIASLLFGFVHGNPWQFAGGVLLGAVLGYVYYRTGSLLMSILLHAFNNSLACLLSFYFSVESLSQLLAIDQFILFIIGLMIFAVSLYFFRKTTAPLLSNQNF